MQAVIEHQRRPRLTGPERRDAILDAALPLFAREGYGRASINAVVAATGVTKPVLYDHFASKRELYLALLERESTTLRAEFETAYDPEAPLDQRLATLARTHIVFVRRRPDAARLLFRTPDGDEVTRAAHERLRAMAREAGTVAILADPAFEATPGLSRATSAALLADLHGAVLERLARWALEHPRTPARVLTTVFVDVLWRGLSR